MGFLKNLFSDPPDPPDYAALAMQQGQMNEDTARLQALLNRPDEYSPYGSRVWTRDPNNPDRYIVTQTLSPDEQAKLDGQNAIMNAMLAMVGQQGLPLISDALSQNFTPPREAQLGWENLYAPDQRLQTESGMYEAPWIQEALDYSGAPGLVSQLNLQGVAGIPQADQETRRRMEQSIYDMSARYLDPQYANRESDLQNRLANQGIQPGSEAYTRAMQEFNDQKARDYGDLRDRAIQGGGQEMANQFGLQLQQHDTGFNDAQIQAALQNSARSQYTGEQSALGAFANQSRSQLIQELLADMSARNNAIVGQSNMATAQQNASNQGTQAWISQKAQAASQPLNLYNAAMSGTQVNNPQWQPYQNNIQWDASPVYNAGVQQYGSALGQFNAGQAQVSNWLNLATKFAPKPGG